VSPTKAICNSITDAGHFAKLVENSKTQQLPYTPYRIQETDEVANQRM
jgi:hypothetical protein